MRRRLEAVTSRRERQGNKVPKDDEHAIDLLCTHVGQLRESQSSMQRFRALRELASQAAVAMPTVIVPAHNEAAVIDDCLATLIADAAPQQFEVIVACNGCTDDTAGRARKFDSKKITVTVIDIPVSSKVAALNACLELAPIAPLVFVDADVQLDASAIQDLCDALAPEHTMAASPSLRLMTDGATWVSRSYHRYWEQIPSIVEGLAGRGVYALSQSGVERLGQFPDLVADDRYIHLLFARGERRTVRSAASTVAIAKTARSIVDRKARVFAGNTEIALLLPPSDDGSWFDVLKKSPRSLVDLPAYLGLNLAAKLASRRVVGWNRDESSRSV